MISQFNHLFIGLPNPDETFLNKLNTLLYNFLWNSKNDTVKRDVVVQNYNSGGLKMVNVRAFSNSLKLSWVRRLIQTSAIWQIILRTFINTELLSTCGTEYIKVCLSNCKNKFWQDVYKAWISLNETNEENIIDGESLLKTPLWFNKYIKIGGKTVFYREWH